MNARVNTAAINAEVNLRVNIAANTNREVNLSGKNKESMRSWRIPRDIMIPSLNQCTCYMKRLDTTD